MVSVLKVISGPEAKGLLARTILRLKQAWAIECRDLCRKGLEKDRWVYIRVDSIYSGLRSEDSKLWLGDYLRQ